jgi:sugar transferase (PEP-CTERM/EpsH1 system associated)
LRILYLAPRECWPPNTGAKLRNYYLARELARHAQLTFLSFADDQSSPESNSEIPQPNTIFERNIVISRPSGYTAGKLLRGAIGGMPLPVLNYFTEEMRIRLAHELNQEHFDVVQIETVPLTAYASVIRSTRSKPLIACDWHNVDSEVMSRYATQTSQVGRQLYARITARRLSSFEEDAMHDLDLHFAVSDRDREKLLTYNPKAEVSVIENGVDVDYFKEDNLVRAGRTAAPLHADGLNGSDRAHRLIFVGSMDYHANADAVIHFVNQAWPKLRELLPTATFTIVGRNPPPVVRALSNAGGIHITGTVDDVRPYYHGALAQIVPLRVGGGSRLKILESMAAGVPVISTSLGAEGLAISHEGNIIIADRNEDMIQACWTLANNSDLKQRLSENGRQLVRDRYDWSAIGRVLFETYVRRLAHV